MSERKVEAFVIHLARATQRRAQVERIVAACPLKTRVLDAVDGRAMSEDERAAVYRADLHEPRYPFRIGPGEIGCFLSHRNAWQTMLDEGLDAALIVEDDVEIELPVFTRALELALTAVDDHGVVQFQVRKIARPGRVIARQGDEVLTRPKVVPLRMSCTLYSRNAARRLLEMTARFDRPVDSMVQMTWLTGLFPLIAIPSGVSEVSSALGGTTVQRTQKPLLGVMRREVLRPLYRLQVSRRAHRALAQFERAGG